MWSRGVFAGMVLMSRDIEICNGSWKRRFAWTASARADVAAKARRPVASICLQVSGELNIAFEGVWGTLGAENPFSNGSGTMSATYGEFSFASEVVATMMGEVGSPGATEIDLLAVVDGTHILFYRLMLPTEALQPNSSFDMSDPRVSSLMVRVELATRQPQVMGFLGEGTFTFGDEVDLTPGGIVKGELNAEIWGGFAEAYGSPGTE